MEIRLGYFFLGMLITSIPTSFYAISATKTDSQVLSEKISEPTPTPTPTISPPPTPTPVPSPQNTPIPIPSPTAFTPTPIPYPMTTAVEIDAWINQYAGQYAVDPNLLKHIAYCESKYVPYAVNGPYAGLFQFTKTYWGSSRKLMGLDPHPDLRLSPEESVRTAAFIISQKGTAAWPSCNK